LLIASGITLSAIIITLIVVIGIGVENLQSGFFIFQLVIRAEEGIVISFFLHFLGKKKPKRRVTSAETSQRSIQFDLSLETSKTENSLPK
jgi:hypothetical protein